MSKAPNKLPNRIGPGDYVIGMLISVFLSALVCAVVLNLFPQWQPGMSTSLRAISNQLADVTAGSLPVGMIVLAVVSFVIKFLFLLIGVLLFLAAWIWLTIWPIYLIKPTGRFLVIALLVISVGPLVFAFVHPDWLHGFPYFIVLALSVMAWLVRTWKWNPDFKSHKRKP
jgi:hypothetical protein